VTRARDATVWWRRSRRSTASTRRGARRAGRARETTASRGAVVARECDAAGWIAIQSIVMAPREEGQISDDARDGEDDMDVGKGRRKVRCDGHRVRSFVRSFVRSLARSRERETETDVRPTASDVRRRARRDADTTAHAQRTSATTPKVSTKQSTAMTPAGARTIPCVRSRDGSSSSAACTKRRKRTTSTTPSRTLATSKTST